MAYAAGKRQKKKSGPEGARRWLLRAECALSSWSKAFLGSAYDFGEKTNPSRSGSRKEPHQLHEKAAAIPAQENRLSECGVSRGQVYPARRVTFCAFTGEAVPTSGEVSGTADARKPAYVTRAAFSPKMSRAIGMGYVAKRKTMKAGQETAPWQGWNCDGPPIFAGGIIVLLTRRSANIGCQRFVSAARDLPGVIANETQCPYRDSWRDPSHHCSAPRHFPKLRGSISIFTMLRSGTGLARNHEQSAPAQCSPDTRRPAGVPDCHAYPQTPSAATGARDSASVLHPPR